MIGVANMIARLITIVAPEVNELDEPQPMLIGCICLFICIVNSFFIKAEVEEHDL